MKKLCQLIKQNNTRRYPYLEGASRELLAAILAVGAPPGAGVPQVVLHEHARDHGATLRCAEHGVVLARVQVRLGEKEMAVV